MGVMMKNNLKALFLHLIIVILSFIFLVIFVATGPILDKYITNTISRVFIGVALILFYIYFGTLLDKNTDKKYDFLVGTFIGVIGIVLWLYMFSKAGVDLFETIPKEISEYWIVMNIYYTPFTLIKIFFGLPNIPILSLITNLIPTLLLGLGLKYKRIKSIKDP